MARPDDYLKTQTVAEALGLSVSTIKRWVDSGTIQAVRTVGKHRLIPRAEAIRMAQELKLEVGEDPQSQRRCRMREPQTIDDESAIGSFRS